MTDDEILINIYNRPAQRIRTSNRTTPGSLHWRTAERLERAGLVALGWRMGERWARLTTLGVDRARLQVTRGRRRRR